jgi:hypothetical protein
LLMRGTVDRGRAEQPDVVWLTEVAHQVVDEPACRWRTCRPILRRDDDVEPASGRDNPSLLLQSSQGGLSGHEGALGLGLRVVAREGVAFCTILPYLLSGRTNHWQKLALSANLCKSNVERGLATDQLAEPPTSARA